ncbi:Tol-Pal system beta propeller repeat protein TolB [Candidatus Albibeggiatoa sp. nov. NOAA]|uniref:Tol-Pal system beta propeller repeat protein TolB n=1 Tax=Candidatus Albibeggiatoa sp. nov. NOAA TaxID=3162724 RepID=UPI0032F575CF|nr:Tol-Pal system beta propeller repeat protein TolB [Thiotrichaceae bacterium]
MQNWIFLLLICFTSSVSATLNIDIVGGNTGGQPIAIVPFANQTGSKLPQNVPKIIAANLHRTGRFAVMPVNQLPEQPSQIGQVNFPTWQQIAMPHFVIGSISGNSATGFTVRFQLLDTFGTKSLIGYSYQANVQTLRQVAHKISDVIYETLTGEKGIFSTRVIYVTVQGRGESKQYQLNVADADGQNPRIMLKSSEPIFSPTWSPDATRVAYVSMENKRTAVYIQNIRSGKRQLLSNYKGINSAPAWSPDGGRIALSLSKDGNPEIYIINLAGRSLTRITNNPAIDTEPEWSPDGKSLVFTSDRSGAPQIYHVSAYGGKAQRVTYIGRYNARARFSPDGQKLALLHNNGKGYQIALLHLPSGQVNALTRTTLDESPSFAPNGSMILYATGSELAAVSVDGKVQQRLAVAAGREVREPAWSPLK